MPFAFGRLSGIFGSVNMFILPGIAVALGIALFWRELHWRSAMRNERRALEVWQANLESEAIAVHRNADSLHARANRAVSAITDALVPEGQNRWQRDKLRWSLHRLAFQEPKKFESECADLAKQSVRSRMPEMPDPIAMEDYDQFDEFNVSDLRDWVKDLRNSGHIPRDEISGTEVKGLRRAEAIRWLLRYNPRQESSIAA